MSRWQYLTVVVLLAGTCFLVFYGNHVLRTQSPASPPDGISGGPIAGGAPLPDTVHRSKDFLTSDWLNASLPAGLPWVALATAVFILTIAAFTFSRKPDSPAILNFVVLNCSLAILIATVQPGTYFTKLFFWFFFFMTPPLMFRLMTCLPEDDSLRQRLLIPVQATMACGLFAGLLSMSLISLQRNQPALITHYQDPLHFIGRLLMFLQGAFILMLLILACVFPLRWVRSLRARRKLQWLLWGMAAGVGPFFLLLYVPFILFGLQHADAKHLVTVLVIPLFLLIPFSTAVAIIRYHFLDIDFLIRRSIILLVTAVLTIGSAFLLALALWLIFFSNGEGFTVLFLVISACLLASCWPLYQHVRRLVEEKFKQFDYNPLEALEKLAAQLCDTVSRDQVINVISRLIVRLFSPDRLVILFQDADGRSFVAHAINMSEESLRKISEVPFDELFGMAGQGDTPTLPLLRQLVDFPTAIPINAAGCPGGMLLLGRRAKGEAYEEKDIRFLNIMADHAGLALRAISGDELIQKALQADTSDDGRMVLQRLASLKHEKENLERLAMTDPLLGCYNRRYFFSALQREIHRAERFSETFGLLMLDLDHFKKINDEAGHAAGDQVLKAFTRIVIGAVRNTDIFCRFGGEEFVLILSRINPETLYLVAEKVRKAVQAADYPVDAPSYRSSVSIGAVLFHGRLAALSPEQLVNQADRALYFAKNNGRNQSVLYDDLPAGWKLTIPKSSPGKPDLLPKPQNPPQGELS